jgi:hypothetical protein
MAWFGALNGDAIDHILPSDWRARLPDPLDKRFTVEYRTLSLVKALKPWTQRGTDSFLGQMICQGQKNSLLEIPQALILMTVQPEAGRLRLRLARTKSDNHLAGFSERH